MTDIDKQLEQVLNLAPIEDDESSTALTTLSDARTALAESNKLMETDKVKEDLEFVREKMREAIQLGSDAMLELLELSRTSQGFEHFTAFASLMKSLNETNRNLIELHKGAIEIETTVAPEADKGPQLDPNTIIGTQRAMMELIRKELGVGRGLEAANQVLVLKADDPGLQS